MVDHVDDRVIHLGLGEPQLCWLCLQAVTHGEHGHFNKDWTHTENEQGSDREDKEFLVKGKSFLARSN